MSLLSRSTSLLVPYAAFLSLDTFNIVDGSCWCENMMLLLHTVAARCLSNTDGAFLDIAWRLPAKDSDTAGDDNKMNPKMPSHIFYDPCIGRPTRTGNPYPT